MMTLVSVLKFRAFAAGGIREIPVKILAHDFLAQGGSRYAVCCWWSITPLGYPLAARAPAALALRQPAFLSVPIPPQLYLQTAAASL